MTCDLGPHLLICAVVPALPYHKLNSLYHCIFWQIPNMSTFSPIAQTSFTNSTAYDAHRPTYPSSSLQHLLTQCRVAGKRGARIIDLAAGTGIFTEALAAREEGYEIIAVEPHADMRKVLVERKLNGVTVVDGTAEDMPVENGWADAVFVAQVGKQFITFSSSSLPPSSRFVGERAFS